MDRRILKLRILLKYDKETNRLGIVVFEYDKGRISPMYGLYFHLEDIMQNFHSDFYSIDLMEIQERDSVPTAYSPFQHIPGTNFVHFYHHRKMGKETDETTYEIDNLMKGLL